MAPFALLVTSLLILPFVHGLPDGAPCEILADPTLTPGHGFDYPPRDATAMFDFQIFDAMSGMEVVGAPTNGSRNASAPILSGTTYQVNVRNLTSDPLEGFVFVAAFTQLGDNTTSLNATFSPISSCVKLQSCSGGSFVTHNTRLATSGCQGVSFNWTAPVFAGSVQFKATFVEDLGDYYGTVSSYDIE